MTARQTNLEKLAASTAQPVLPGAEPKRDAEPLRVTCEREKSERCELWKAVALGVISSEMAKDAAVTADSIVKAFARRYQQTAPVELMEGGDPFK